MIELILIHGRAEKPSEEELASYVEDALVNGINRLGNGARAKLDQCQVTQVYYGDISNAILWGAKQSPKRTPREGYLQDWPYEPLPTGVWKASQHVLFNMTDQEQGPEYYHAKRKTHHDLAFLDDLSNVLAPIATFFRLYDDVLKAGLPDLKAYFDYRIVGSEIRGRLQEAILEAWKKDREVILISHSMGTIVAYDVAWKLSRMWEYRQVRHKKFKAFITLGSPLGDKGVRDQLYDATEPPDGKFPTNLGIWHNFSAQDDFICHDTTLADDFAEMQYRSLVASIQDHFLYNCWIEPDGTLNPHNHFAYLDNRRFAEVLAGLL